MAVKKKMDVAAENAINEQAKGGFKPESGSQALNSIIQK